MGCRLTAICLGVICMVSTDLAAQVIVAHRGASYDAPENTISAFRLAWEQKADGIEADFYFTKDNKVVCIHDADTERTGGKKLKVADSTLAELRELEYGAWKAPKFAGEPLPTFDEVLAVVPRGKLFVIELKTGPDIVPLIADTLAADIRSQSGKKFLFISFHPETVAKCKEMLPAIDAHYLTGFKQDKRTGEWAPDVDVICKTAAQCRADGVGMKGERAVVTKDFIHQLKQQGVRDFHVWTIDKPEDARFFQTLGPFGITTNRPALIRASLAAQTK